MAHENNIEVLTSLKNMLLIFIEPRRTTRAFELFACLISLNVYPFTPSIPAGIRRVTECRITTFITNSFPRSPAPDSRLPTPMISSPAALWHIDRIRKRR